jgi:enoyl-[acyl-carrier-protein] reductase (NADH)
MEGLKDKVIEAGGGGVVNTISAAVYGGMATNVAYQATKADVRDQVLLTAPSFRHGEPADIGAMAAFLLSDLAEWVTGQAICVDGGTTMRA